MIYNRKYNKCRLRTFVAFPEDPLFQTTWWKVREYPFYVRPTQPLTDLIMLNEHHAVFISNVINLIIIDKNEQKIDMLFVFTKTKIAVNWKLDSPQKCNDSILHVFSENTNPELCTLFKHMVNVVMHWKIGIFTLVKMRSICDDEETICYMHCSALWQVQRLHANLR